VSDSFSSLSKSATDGKDMNVRDISKYSEF